MTLLQPLILRLTSLMSAFDSTDIPIAVLILGLVLMGYGASRFHDGAGHVVVGVALALLYRPALRWIK